MEAAERAEKIRCSGARRIIIAGLINPIFAFLITNDGRENRILTAEKLKVWPPGKDDGMIRKIKKIVSQDEREKAVKKSPFFCPIWIGLDGSLVRSDAPEL